MSAIESSAESRDFRTAGRFNRNVKHDMMDGSTIDEITKITSDITPNWKDIRTYFGYKELGAMQRTNQLRGARGWPQGLRGPFDGLILHLERNAPRSRWQVTKH